MRKGCNLLRYEHANSRAEHIRLDGALMAFKTLGGMFGRYTQDSKSSKEIIRWLEDTIMNVCHEIGHIHAGWILFWRTSDSIGTFKHPRLKTIVRRLSRGGILPYTGSGTRSWANCGLTIELARLSLSVHGRLTRYTAAWGLRTNSTNLAHLMRPQRARECISMPNVSKRHVYGATTRKIQLTFPLPV